LTIIGQCAVILAKGTVAARTGKAEPTTTRLMALFRITACNAAKRNAPISLLFGVDVKLAGSLSLAVSLPTMLVGFARYSRDRSFIVLAENRRFVLVMAAGSILGSFLGGLLLGVVPNAVLLPLLAVILVLSAVKVWTHK
jgi:hypothetical protein